MDTQQPEEGYKQPMGRKTVQRLGVKSAGNGRGGIYKRAIDPRQRVRRRDVEPFKE